MKTYCWDKLRKVDIPNLRVMKDSELRLDYPKLILIQLKWGYKRQLPIDLIKIILSYLNAKDNPKISKMMVNILPSINSVNYDGLWVVDPYSRFRDKAACSYYCCSIIYPKNTKFKIHGRGIYAEYNPINIIAYQPTMIVKTVFEGYRKAVIYLMFKFNNDSKKWNFASFESYNIYKIINIEVLI